MKKTTNTILLLLLTAFMYGQNSTLLKNINYRANELKHSLNKSGDTLLLEGERTIFSVSFFNNKFEKRISIRNNKASIPLKDIPLGRFTTEVKLSDKLIILTLLRHEPILASTKINTNTINDATTAKVLETTKESNTTLSSNSGSKSYESFDGLAVANGKIIEVEPKKAPIVTGYWIICKIQNGNSGRTINRIGDKKVVDKMIAQNKLDMKTRLGKFNALTIWEVYDTSKFMRFKRINPEYANAESAESFNTIPYYDTERDSMIE
ncbi:hypothetical protein [Winogradskyella vincentii]|uniref:Uncharacterized protein n=1 Tax=Winogradskyella vincentii TaxID=2877122 RepID=A0ABS7Y3X8_9FLAO|nr:hypothetical protein [Winogradskyella vincentii]MCA0154311.1 hypothetical protein [Winogradskyella vincentii]